MARSVQQNNTMLGYKQESYDEPPNFLYCGTKTKDGNTTNAHGIDSHSITNTSTVIYQLYY